MGIFSWFGAVAQSGRALQSHCRGQGFEPPQLHCCKEVQAVRHRSSGVEHSIRNRAVVGSIPTGGSLHLRHSGIAGVAQLVEHQLPKLRVAGSNPVSRSVTGGAEEAEAADGAEVAMNDGSLGFLSFPGFLRSQLRAVKSVTL